MKDFRVALLLISAAVAQQLIDDPYCFRFTWLGSKFNANSTYLNATCDEVTRGADVPCTRPLVATENSRLPNITFMWTDLPRSDIACRMTPENVCVKYSYYYNHALENITYLCTKVTIENEGAAKSGCYSEFQDGREIEVCVCRSTPGEMPQQRNKELVLSIEHNLCCAVQCFFVSYFMNSFVILLMRLFSANAILLFLNNCSVFFYKLTIS